MKILNLLLVLPLLVLSGCGSTASIPNPVTSARSYNGTASVGDFLTITLDPVAHTLTYTDISNGDSGIVPYTVNADGTYALNDSTGNLVAAYEVPNYALLIQAAKTGANQRPARAGDSGGEGNDLHDHLGQQQLQLHAVPHGGRRAGSGFDQHGRIGRMSA